jgi:hypothetical protein
MVIAHAEEGSAVAAALLRDWRRERFLVVEPREEPAISLPIESTTAAAH